MNAGRLRERLMALFIAGVVVINYPLLHLFDTHKIVLGIPLLYLYLFGCWGAIIALIVLVTERKRNRDQSGTGSGVSGKG